MAPRGRTRKVGLTRMDAAIDALLPMRYSSKYIRKKVNELLKVYGKEGWIFIEDGSYRALIDYILEDQNCEQGEASSKNQGGDQGITDDEPSQPEPSSQDIEALCDSEDALLFSPVTVLDPLLPLAGTKVHPLMMRKPCLGWIGPKDDEDFVLLNPAPVRGWGIGEKQKRKSRWDVGPDDTN